MDSVGHTGHLNSDADGGRIAARLQLTAAQGRWPSAATAVGPALAQHVSRGHDPAIARRSDLPLSETADDLDAIYRKMAKRIIPFMVLLFLMAWLTGHNRLREVADGQRFGLQRSGLRFGAGIVYLGYMLFEIPATYCSRRSEPARPFARITILWGITSMAMVLQRPPRFPRAALLLGCSRLVLPGVIVI